MALVTSCRERLFCVLEWLSDPRRRRASPALPRNEMIIRMRQIHTGQLAGFPHSDGGSSVQATIAAGTHRGGYLREGPMSTKRDLGTNNQSEGKSQTIRRAAKEMMVAGSAAEKPRPRLGSKEAFGRAGDDVWVAALLDDPRRVAGARSPSEGHGP